MRDASTEIDEVHLGDLVDTDDRMRVTEAEVSDRTVGMTLDGRPTLGLGEFVDRRPSPPGP